MLIATHDGPFHADDVFGAALLMSVFPEADLIRTRDSSRLAHADIVFDVGRTQDVSSQRFDHHSLVSEKRPNGIIYSSFGLLWREYGAQYCDSNRDIWNYIDKFLVESIDANDNGQAFRGVNEFNITEPTIDAMVRTFNIIPDGDFDAQFFKVVKKARSLLQQLKVYAKSIVDIKEEIAQQHIDKPNKEYVVIKHYIPVHDLRGLPETLKYVVCRETDDRWLICGIQDADHFNSIRTQLPAAWAGLADEAFVTTTGVKAAQSCHRNRFIAIAYTEAAAVALVEKALA